jgi:ribose transport system permease protein
MSTGAKTIGEKNGVKAILNPLKALIRKDEFGVLLALLVICYLLAMTTDTFMKPFNLLQVTRQASYIGIMAIGAVFVLSMGDVDLSVGSVFMLASIITGICMRAGLNPYLAVLVGIVFGAICGLINGGLSVLLKIPTIIVTLGTMSIYRSLGLVLAEGRTVHQFPKEGFLFDVLGGQIGPIPGSTVVFLVLMVLGHLLYNRTAFGRRVCAIGSNHQAALFSGVRITHHRLMVMMLQGSLAAFAGILAMFFLKSADTSYGQGYELEVIAAAIIGGTSLGGGEGTVIGAFIGALITAVIRNGLVLLGVEIYWTGAATGAVIIGAVALDYFIKRRRNTS